VTDLEAAVAAGAKPVTEETDLDRALKAGATPVEAQHEDKVAPYGLSGVVSGDKGGRPTDFLGRLKFAAQHPIESLKDEIPKAIEGGQAAADNILNTASLGVYHQFRDARDVKEALTNTAPASARTEETERFNAEHPVVKTGSELVGTLYGGPKMLAEAGGAVLGPVLRGADNLIGRKAADILARPATAPGPVSKFVKKALERGIHAVVGHSVGGVPGLITSQVLSPLAHDATAAIGSKISDVVRNRVLSPMAQRYLSRTAPQLAEDSGLLMSDAVPPRKPLAPLVSTAKPDIERLAPYFDEITGQPLTNVGKPIYSEALKNHGTVGGATNPGGKVAGLNSLRDDVMRDAKAATGESMPKPGASPEVDVAMQLRGSLRILDELKVAKADGTLTPKMAQAAVKAGLAPATVAKIAGADMLPDAPYSVKVLARVRKGEPLSKAVKDLEEAE
jgi:hypothetical protein